MAVVFEAEAPGETGAFWAALLDRVVVADPGGVLVPGDERQVGLRFVEATTAKPEWNRLHLHVTSGSEGDQRRTVAVAVEHGGRDLVAEDPEVEAGRLLLLGATRTARDRFTDPDGSPFTLAGDSLT